LFALLKAFHHDDLGIIVRADFDHLLAPFIVLPDEAIVAAFMLKLGRD